MNQNEKDLRRLMMRTEKTATCWIWKGSQTKGYGQFYFRGSNYAHRASWVLHNRKQIPKGYLVMHSCDTPLCVNPQHLSVGTQKENMQDASRKGRTRNASDWRGTKNPKSKLTKIQMEKLIKLLRSKSNPEIARLFGVSRTRVWQIRKQVANFNEFQ